MGTSGRRATWLPFSGREATPWSLDGPGRGASPIRIGHGGNPHAQNKRKPFRINRKPLFRIVNVILRYDSRSFTRFTDNLSLSLSTRSLFVHCIL